MKFLKQNISINALFKTTFSLQSYFHGLLIDLICIFLTIICCQTIPIFYSILLNIAYNKLLIIFANYFAKISSNSVRGKKFPRFQPFEIFEIICIETFNLKHVFELKFEKHYISKNSHFICTFGWKVISMVY